jgi:PIN domain nuclease of toxin-antitoxin system
MGRISLSPRVNLGRLMNKLILDTHVWVWLINGDKRLAASKALSWIEKASKINSVYVSAISVWEVAMLEAKGRISFTVSCMDWVQNALSAPGIILLPIHPEIAVESTRLPGEFHGDPADRIIVASARKLDIALVTEDSKIRNYANGGHVRMASGI